MNDIIKVNYDNADRPTVSGRELHKALKIETPYTIELWRGREKTQKGAVRMKKITKTINGKEYTAFVEIVRESDPRKAEAERNKTS